LFLSHNICKYAKKVNAAFGCYYELQYYKVAKTKTIVKTRYKN